MKKGRSADRPFFAPLRSYFAYSTALVSRRTWDLDLAGVGEFVFNLLGDVSREQDHLVLADLVGLDHDADFAAGLDGIAAVDAGGSCA